MASNRHLCRIVAMQTLYEWDFRFQKVSPKSKEDIKYQDELLSILKRNIAQFTKEIEDTKFIEKLVDEVIENLVAIDKIMAPAAPEWPIEQIAIIDRNILRIGIYELLFSDEVPPKVAINEAVELGKTFGGENSSKFVNGVLGSIYRASPKYQAKPEEKEIPK